MPNHVTNILNVSGGPKRMAELFEAVKTEKYGLGSIDFAKIIPVPDYIYQGDFGPAEMAKYGKNNWLDWNTSNWGSKWNSYGYDEFTSKKFDGENLRFQTAWSSVHQVIGRLAEMYPDLEFSYCWADEDFGNNVGRREYSAGEETECYLPNGGSKEALEMAAEVHQVDLEDEGYLWNEEAGEYEFHHDSIGMELT